MHRYDCKTCCYYDRLTGLCGVCMKKILRELKEAVKANKVISFLSGQHEKTEQE